MAVEAKAVARYIRMSPRKVRMVVDMIRGKSVEEALNQLHFVPKHGAEPVAKLVRSAVANAMNTEAGSKLNPEDLVVKEIQVGGGPTMRRYNPGPQGRATLIRKRSCHVSIVVSERTS